MAFSCALRFILGFGEPSSVRSRLRRQATAWLNRLLTELGSPFLFYIIGARKKPKKVFRLRGWLSSASWDCADACKDWSGQGVDVLQDRLGEGRSEIQSGRRQFSSTPNRSRAQPC